MGSDWRAGRSGDRSYDLASILAQPERRSRSATKRRGVADLEGGFALRVGVGLAEKKGSALPLF